ncbi:MAG: discoidin domain-containing protein [Pseudomonadota bacterium]
MIITTSDRLMALDQADLLHHPFLFWDNLGAGADLFGSSILAGGDRFNAVNGTTADFWIPNPVQPNGVLNFDMGAPVTLTCAAIEAHNLAEFGLTARIDASDDNTSWQSVGPAHTPADNAPLLWRFNPTTARYWRLVINTVDPADSPAVGVVMLGRELIMPQRIYSGYAPVIAPNIVALNSNVSVGGHLMGASTQSQGARISLPFDLIKAEFVRGHLLPFIEAFNRGRGFFAAWLPSEHPEDVHYCWRDGSVIHPSNMGTLTFQDFTIDARVYYDR